MSDPSDPLAALPWQPSATPLSEAERAALLASLTDEERAALLAAVPNIAAPPPPAGSIGLASGRHVLEFESPAVAAGTEVALVVDGERYQCSESAPVDALVAVLDAYRTNDRMTMMLAIRPLLSMCLYPEARARYDARCKGMVEVPARVGPDGVELPARVLPAIGLEQLIDHGIKLVEVYLGRPMAAPPSSGIGGASGSTPSASTAGPWPAA